MSKKYTIIEETPDYISCHGVYEYFEGIGHLICLANDDIEEWKSNGYSLTIKDEFFRLEADTGFGWHYEFVDYRIVDNEVINTNHYEHWYLLEVPDKECNNDI